MRRCITLVPLSGCTGALTPSSSSCGGGDGYLSSSSPLPPSSSSSSSSSLSVSARYRLYKPLVNSGVNFWRRHMGKIHPTVQLHLYRREKADPRPYPEPSVNNFHGRGKLWNPIAGKIGLVNKKAAEWGWPHRPPPPAGLRYSPEYFPYFFDRYFPDAEFRLVLDSVLNTETRLVVFHVPPSISKREVENYLRNVYNIHNIVRVGTKNMRGARYKDELGTIKERPDYKLAFVELDSPVLVEMKQIKGAEDTPDNRPNRIDSDGSRQIESS